MKSQEYYSLIEQYKLIHKQTHYGASSSQKAKWIVPYVNFKVDSLLDYGCGRSRLAQDLGAQLGCKNIYRYDPAIKGFDILPVIHVDLLTCTEVLEHVPQQDLYEVLYDLKKLSDKCFFTVCTRTAAKVLPDGRNAHATVKPLEWWLQLLNHVFFTVDAPLITSGEGFHARTWI